MPSTTVEILLSLDHHYSSSIVVLPPVIFKGSIFHLISKFKDAIFMNFCYGQYNCNTFEVFQGFIFHEFGLYHEI